MIRIEERIVGWRAWIADLETLEFRTMSKEIFERCTEGKLKDLANIWREE